MVQQAIVGCRYQRKLFSSSPLKHSVVSNGENNAFKQAAQKKKNRGRSNKYARKWFPLTDYAGEKRMERQPQQDAKGTYRLDEQNML